MTRRRKNDTKTPIKTTVKESPKFTAVRKSTRQIAKKQLEEQKINGEVIDTLSSNDLELTNQFKEDCNERNVKKTLAVIKKTGKGRRPFNGKKNNEKEVILASQIVGDILNRKTNDDNNQELLENKINSMETPVMEDACKNNFDFNLTSQENVSKETWSEDVIEETIICEEMELEADNAQIIDDNKYTLEQDNKNNIQHILTLNELTVENESILQFDTLSNKDVTHAMDIDDCNNMNSLSTTSPGCKIGTNVENDTAQIMNEVDHSPVVNNETNISSSRINNSEIIPYRTAAARKEYKCFKDKDLAQQDMNKIKKNSTRLREFPLFDGDDFNTVEKRSANKRKSNVEYRSTKPPIFLSKTAIENKEQSHVTASSTEAYNNMEMISGVEKEITMQIEKTLTFNESEDINLLPINKIENIDFHDISDDKPVQRKELKKDESIFEKEYYDLKMTPKGPLTSKVIQEVPLVEKSEKEAEHLQCNMEEHSRDSEIDKNVDFEDIKVSSSSENSNDTLASVSSSCKIFECNSDNKSSLNCFNEVDKKLEFRSRSGSTDTTGSESGSNSSNVRRSSRIRSIGLMKQRSRGRGLVTKPNVDASKVATQQDNDKVISTPPIIQEQRDILDALSETQSDRENTNTKTATSLDSSTTLATTSGTTSGYDSDSSKPVKVKSRWRRSSELEMGNSSSTQNSHSNTFTTNLSSIAEVSFIDAINLHSEASTTQSVKSIDRIKTVEPENRTSFSTTTTKVVDELNTASENNSTTNNTPTIYSTSSAAETIGSKIPLPMVIETRDREMEERLSQFEYLRENLYLTERYTNKETKRMVCDCFLTEEEIERGELGCGEDCLNRLLMIECGPRCVVGDRCTNKRFQNCDYAKCEVFRTEKKGFGLRATVDLMAGEFVMEYVGEVVNPKDFRRRAKEYSKEKNRHYYFMALKSDQIIDATMKGNVSRFINHSCDPNAETQKWTVNGELRIGFFIKKFISAGEEITFDYHFQRYGKEAQKCYCEAPNCRGWIGDNPEKTKERQEREEEDEDEDEEEIEEEEVEEEVEEEELVNSGGTDTEKMKDVKEKVEKVEKKMKRVRHVTRKKKEEKKPADYMEDEDLEEEIDKLCMGGLKNRAHTLTLSRLMVRSRELEHRTRLLRVIQSGEQPCRRLFLDYHGLRLIWSYMMDIAGNETEKAQQFRLEVLKTLKTLPIPNKTMLMDSKVYSVVEKWANQMFLSASEDSPEDEQFKSKALNDDVMEGDSNEKVKETDLLVKQEPTSEQALITDLASKILAGWSSLKEVFRIPKKERIEQMKEHEREADRGYKEELEKETRRERSYERHRLDNRYIRNETERRPDRRRGRESPDPEHTSINSRPKDKRNEERINLVPVRRMTKYERRQLFALKVAKEEEERQRRQQQELWQEHEARCLALGMDPHTTAALDPQTGYPLYFNQTLGQWQPYPMQDNPDIAHQCAYIEGPSHQVLTGQQPPMPSQTPHLPQTVLPAVLTAEIPPGLSPSMYSINTATSTFSQSSASYPAFNSAHHQQYLDNSLQVPGGAASIQVHNGTGPSIPNQVLLGDKQITNSIEVEPEAPSHLNTPPPLDLPPKWKWAKDDRGRVYYYHIKERISQWLPPEPDHIGVQPDSSSSSESSEESSSSNEEDEEEEEEEENVELNNRLTQQPDEDIDLESTLSDGISNPKQRKVDILNDNESVLPDTKKRRDGLVQERIISPRREEDRVDHKKYREYKEKLKRQKERARLKEHIEKSRKHRRSNKSKSHSRHSTSKLQTVTSECSPTTERRIKDEFRINMANVMVHFLNPYRKNDCKQGRITNTEDFKHLARKLTHFVLAKELKHCRSVDELQCNDNVKHKAKDFVRKYMSKFGPVYQKSTDED